MKRWIILCIPVFLFACGKKEVNQTPIVSFTINPVNGDHYTLFEFNGAGTIDPDGPDSLLKYRWDWESDGYYDQLYDRNPLIRHRFENHGSYQITLQVMDAAGEVAETSLPLHVDRGSRPPLDPFSPNPKDSANNILYSGRLSWVSIDPDEDRMFYDLYLGTNPNPPLWIEGHDTTFIQASHLLSGFKYYWKVVSHDTTGQSTTGPVWTFSIHSGLYETSEMTDPRDGKTYPILKIGSVWWMTENLQYDLGNLSRSLHGLEENVQKYGRYYHVGLADTLLCPGGWGLPDGGVLWDLERKLGMSDDDIRRSGVYRGNDQGTQLSQGGTSGLNLNYAGYLDSDGKWQLVDEAAHFGAYRNFHFPTRMIRKGYGGILSATLDGVEYSPVRCVKYD